MSVLFRRRTLLLVAVLCVGLASTVLLWHAPQPPRGAMSDDSRSLPDPEWERPVLIGRAGRTPPPRTLPGAAVRVDSAVDLQLGELVVRCRESTGRAVEGARVTAMSTPLGVARQPMVQAQGRTDASGVCHLSSLSRTSVDVDVEAEGFLTVRVPMVPPAAQLELQLVRGPTLIVQATSGGASGVAAFQGSVAAYARASDGQPLRCINDFAGSNGVARVVVGPLPVGAHVYEVRAVVWSVDGGPAEAQVACDGTLPEVLRVTLSDSPILRGVVVDEESRTPVSGAQVWVPGRPPTVSDGLGEFKLPLNVTLGSEHVYTAIASPDHVPEFKQVDVSAIRAGTAVTLGVRRGREVVLQLIGPDGHAVSASGSVYVVPASGSGQVAEVPVVATATVSIHIDPAVHYVVIPVLEGLASTPYALCASDDPPRRVSLQLYLPRRLRGRVMGCSTSSPVLIEVRQGGIELALGNGYCANQCDEIAREWCSVRHYAVQQPGREFELDGLLPGSVEIRVASADAACRRNLRAVLPWDGKQETVIEVPVPR